MHLWSCVMYTVREISISLSFKGPVRILQGLECPPAISNPCFGGYALDSKKRLNSVRNSTIKLSYIQGLHQLASQLANLLFPRARKPQASAIEGSIMKHRKGRNEIKVMNGLGILQVIID
ncbi:hypothetical protein I7I53_08628 [Histoplasma capsulatum var. duboisii H88]|uniref:Uncharacterized protein n=1 Tax=Ajellomyces capsulatus (strain H88) TaxID=544711 RepID=A0A8A1LG63_AJEC8|nr:hypothetical protein I7I53_08628 [Histoplasma capsulatum var. duboisii H88]